MGDGSVWFTNCISLLTLQPCKADEKFQPRGSLGRCPLGLFTLRLLPHCSCCGHKAEPHAVVPAPLMAQDRGTGPVSSPLTTHVLDTASGLPAQGLGLRLSRLEDHGQQWTELRTR